TLGIVRLPLVAAEKAGSSRRRWGSIFMLGCGRVRSWWFCKRVSPGNLPFGKLLGILPALLPALLTTVLLAETDPISAGKKRPPGYVPAPQPVPVIVVLDRPRFVDADPGWELVRNVESLDAQAAYRFSGGDWFPDLEVVLFRAADLGESNSRRALPAAAPDQGFGIGRAGSGPMAGSNGSSETRGAGDRLASAAKRSGRDASRESETSRPARNSQRATGDTIVRVEGLRFQDGSFSRKAIVMLPMYGYQDRLRRSLLQGLAIWALRDCTDGEIVSMLTDYESRYGRVRSRGSVRNTLSYVVAVNPKAVDVDSVRPLLKRMLEALKALKDLDNEETFAEEEPPYTFAWPMAREQAIKFLSGIEYLPEYDKIPSLGGFSEVKPVAEATHKSVTWGLDTDTERYRLPASLRRGMQSPRLLRDPFRRPRE
ncbi:MAG: hypothetical protein AB1646_25440, partial [Thermodesulfobacteriota bacterium]